MHLSAKLAGLTAALTLMAVPALAAPPAGVGKSPVTGKSTTAPGQICKNMSRQNPPGPARSAFAECVVGAARANREARNEADDPQATSTAPGQMCKDRPRKKVKGQPKSAFASCVTGAAKAQKLQREQEQEQEEEQAGQPA